MVDLATIAAQFSNDDAPAMSVAHAGLLWRWKSKKTDAPAAWFFITIDGAAGEAIAAGAGPRGGFASVRVEVQVGRTSWQTSLFPSKDPPGFLLPIKAAVRKAEALSEGGMVQVDIALI